MTQAPLFARRDAVLLACTALALQITTVAGLWFHAPVAVILALPLLSLICLSIAIVLSPAGRYEAPDPATWEASSRGLWELELYANQGSRR